MMKVLNKKSIFILWIITMLVFQIVNPTLVYADGETPPTDAPVETATPPVPTDVVVTESPAPDNTASTPDPIVTEAPVESASPAVDPAATSAPVEEIAPAPTELINPVESPAAELSSAPTDAPVSLPTDPPILATSAPVEASTPVESSAPVPTESATEIASEEKEKPESAQATQDPIQSTPTEASAMEQPTLLETVAAIAGNTSVVILDASGQPMPLVTQSAARALMTGQAMWCPDGVAPGGADCTTGYSSVGALITAEGANIDTQSVNGTIWIPSTKVEPAGVLSIDGATYTNWANHGLTLQAGWSGIIGDTTIGSNTVMSGVLLDIQGWKSDVTLNNITVDGGGAEVFTSQNITIDNSTFSNSFVTQDGANLSAGGNIHINNSIFSENDQSGANLIATGNIDINNSTFSENGLSGLVIHTTDGNVNIDNSTFSENNVAGIDATAAIGNVTISNSTVSNNNVGVKGSSKQLTLNCVKFQGNKKNNGGSFGSSKETPCPTHEAAPIEPDHGDPSFFVPPDAKTIDVPLECSQDSRFRVKWHSGDQFLISCVTNGIARITRMDNTDLSHDLPAGYEYVAAYKVEIFQNEISLPVMPENGSILTSFASRNDNPNYGVMAWDERNTDWALLKSYQKDPSGAPSVFPLNPSNSQDTHRILSGARFISPNREEVITNFASIFVLVQ